MSLGLADHPTLSACADPARSRWRDRVGFWRSPDGQPAWARPALLGVAAVAAALYAWNLADAGFAPFYSVAVKSMSQSWKAFFYGAFDPAATVTIDKLAGSFLPQALSARIFGFHAWSLALPQVIEGVISVLAMHRVVRRWAGPAAGLLAAAIFALTPVAASMFGHSMEDGALTMCLVLAADSWQRAVSQARLRPLLWSAVWVGLGFQAKMLQAWMIVPALALGYLAAAPAGLRRRLWRLGAAGSVMLAVSMSWIALYTFTPAGSRPYVDGSTDNSAVAMVFGYNGLERFGIRVPGAVTSGPGVTVSEGGPVSGGVRHGGASPGGAAGPGGPAGLGGAGGPGGAAGEGSSRAGGSATGGSAGGPAGASAGGSGAPRPGSGAAPASGSGTAGAPGAGQAGAFPAGRTAARPGGTAGGGSDGGWAKLLGSRFGPEIGWLYPLALLALVAGLISRRRAGRADQMRSGLVMWGGWLLTFGAVYSVMSSIPHTAYMASLAPPLAALSGAGIVMLVRWHRSGERRGWLLPLAVAAETAWALRLWSAYPEFLPWARWGAAAGGAVAVAALVAARLAAARGGGSLDAAPSNPAGSNPAGSHPAGPHAGSQRRAGGRRRPGLARRPGRWLAGVAAVAAVASMLAAPATWSASVLDVAYAGSSFDASAGPAASVAGIAGSGPASAGRAARLADGAGAGEARLGAGALARFGGGAPGGLQASATTALSVAERRVYDYVSAHRSGASYLMAVSSWSQASPYIMATGEEVLPLGGFSGSVPEPTLARVQELVRSGKLRFFLLDGAEARGAGSGAGGSERSAIAAWVEGGCSAVPAADHGGSASAAGAAGGGSGAGASGSGTLYECGTQA